MRLYRLKNLAADEFYHELVGIQPYLDAGDVEWVHMPQPGALAGKYEGVLAGEANGGWRGTFDKDLNRMAEPFGKKSCAPLSYFFIGYLLPLFAYHVTGDADEANALSAVTAEQNWQWIKECIEGTYPHREVVDFVQFLLCPVEAGYEDWETWYYVGR